MNNNAFRKSTKLVGKINSVVAREEVNLDVNELFIVEFYSRK